MNKERKSKKIIIIVVVAAIAVFAAAGICVYYNFYSQLTETSQGVAGKILKDWDTGATEPGTAKSSGTQIPGYSTAEMKAGDTVLHLSVGNPKANECGFYATVKLSDGTELYKSQLLEPGSGLTDIPLSKTLEKGEYKAMVLYECVTLDDDHKPLNSAESEFTLIVK